MSSAVVRAEGLTKHFGSVEALDGLDLIVEQGEVVGYLGPNGAGKTTTLRLLLDEPTSGLDPLLQVEFASLVREVSQEGASVLLSSHIVREVEALADRVAILRRGHLVSTVDIADLRDRARQRLDLHIDGGADPTPFERLDPVIECHANGDVVHLVIEGSVEPIIKAAARLHVRRIDTHDSDLEDVFLAYYRDDA